MMLDLDDNIKKQNETVTKFVFVDSFVEIKTTKLYGRKLKILTGLQGSSNENYMEM